MVEWMALLQGPLGGCALFGPLDRHEGQSKMDELYFSIHQDEGRKPPKIIISFRLKMCIVGKLQVAFFQDRKLARYHKS